METPRYIVWQVRRLDGWDTFSIFYRTEAEARECFARTARVSGTELRAATEGEWRTLERTP